METKIFNKYKDKGLSGSKNTKYMLFKLCIQILSHTYELNDFLNDGEYKNKVNENLIQYFY